MGRIRIAHFDEFKGEETLFLGTDPEGLAHLLQVAETLAAGGEAVHIDRSSMVQSNRSIRLIASAASQDIGLVSSGPLKFTWQRSCDGWREVANKLSTMRDRTPSHQYLDGPHDELQLIASVGEYEEEWWNDVANSTVPADAKRPPRR